MAESREGVSVGISLNVSGEVAENPLAVIRGLTQAVRSVDSKLREAVQEARHQKCTWEEIGEALGVSRQAAWERFSIE